MLSYGSGLGDRIGGSLTVFLHALLTDRAFEYVWYGQHVLWDTFQSPWIDWRAPPRNLSMGATVPAPPGSGGAVLPMVTENHHWRLPNRSTLYADFYLEAAVAEPRAWVRDLYGSGDLMSYGDGYDVVLWTQNQGLLALAFENPNLQKRLQALGLRWELAVPCLFNFLYVPSPAALSLFRRGNLLDVLLDPDNTVIGVQVRLGDWVFSSEQEGGQSLDDAVLARGYPHFECAQQLTDELNGVARPDEEWDGEGEEHYGAQFWDLAGWGSADSENSPRHKQEGLHAAAGEMWLFGLAAMHVVTTNSAFARLGAVAAGPKSLYGNDTAKYRVYGIPGWRRDCRLSSPDPLEAVASWWVGLHR
ncbi:hypothetical protein GPECTOR_6g628 [Gonium pectorale]|uniref:Uncharacterized protein n=1 Tax=Gonium pectorale TaxID=33097 RepID=A0A150GV51_GONPE|nr:hypothetical protein GPECTOR_6g628 [Gonium pectorale]|eukprot:KXZ53711.1 hypothetical protein GPECTOR_6g628 [Gonium pectorale]